MFYKKGQSKITAMTEGSFHRANCISACEMALLCAHASATCRVVSVAT